VGVFRPRATMPDMASKSKEIHAICFVMFVLRGQ
jgi:hypothetical protein